MLVEKRGRQEHFPPFSCNSFKERILGEQISFLLTKLQTTNLCSFARIREEASR